MDVQLTRGLFWFVSAFLIVAAAIDGWKLKVPNWLTFPLAGAGLSFHAIDGGGWGLLAAFAGLVVGLGLFLPTYAIGWMGAGDVKLFAAFGAWVGPAIAFQTFPVVLCVGAAMALLMMLYNGNLAERFRTMKSLAWEVFILRDPVKLSTAAAERKPRMTLLPYGIPIAVGSIAYLAMQVPLH